MAAVAVASEMAAVAVAAVAVAHEDQPEAKDPWTASQPFLERGRRVASGRRPKAVR